MHSVRAVILGLLVTAAAQAQFGSNARQIQGRNVCTTTPADTQLLMWSASSNCYKPYDITADMAQINYREDFVGGGPSHVWATAGTGTVTWAAFQGTTVEGSGAGYRLATKASTPASGDDAHACPGTCSPTMGTLGSGGTFRSWYTGGQFWIDTVGSGALANVGFYMGSYRTSVTNGGGGTNSVQVRADTSGAITCTNGGGAYTTTNLVLVLDVSGTTYCADLGVAAQAATKYTIVLASPTKGTVTAAVNGGTPASITQANALTYAQGLVYGIVTRTAAVKTMQLAHIIYHQDGLTQ